LRLGEEKEMHYPARPVQVAIQVTGFPISLVCFYKVFGDPLRDSFTITNGLSVIAAAIAALAFTAASVYQENSRRRESFKLGGVRFFIASMMAGIGSVTKYAGAVGVHWARDEHLSFEVMLIPFLLYFLTVSAFFGTALIYSHLGLWTLVGELFSENN
jgi:hypothetical protein